MFYRWKKLSCGKWRGVIQKHVFTLDRDESNVYAEVHDNKSGCVKTTKGKKNNKSNSNDGTIKSYIILFLIGPLNYFDAYNKLIFVGKASTPF